MGNIYIYTDGRCTMKWTDIYNCTT